MMYFLFSTLFTTVCIFTVVSGMQQRLCELRKRIEELNRRVKELEK